LKTIQKPVLSKSLPDTVESRSLNRSPIAEQPQPVAAARFPPSALRPQYADRGDPVKGAPLRFHPAADADAFAPPRCVDHRAWPDAQASRDWPTVMPRRRSSCNAPVGGDVTAQSTHHRTS